ncbi:ankyrin repeat-containing domain protein [Rhodocollybia butyracea]|uniref:Ankyrin repeat-containing domain protein n=1 Tax=Rhodocollybia butyracea TaxID=206335 RepID=A0A9P5P3W6_9AGAR|nr:ankyrin repeat-containing domain protein [Rhodocollybia butyracea]
MSADTKQSQTVNQPLSIFANASNFIIDHSHFQVATGNITNYHTTSIDMETKIYEWLRAPECSVNFQTAVDKKTDGTGQWLLEHSMYKNWTQAETSNILWIQGKAGSGKTFLSTTIIQDLQETAPRNVWYHYFDSRDNTGMKSTYRGLMLSLLQQVGSNADGIHSDLQKLFDKCKHGMTRPAIHDLEHVFRSILIDVGLGYIILDAMDECKEKHEVYMWLNEAQRFPTLHMAITSRDHMEQNMIGPLHQIFLNNPGINQDIVLHLDRKIVECGFKDKLHDEIKKSLMEQAQGKFRWVDCQLRDLQKCGSPSAVRKALQSLPKDLEETYTMALAKAAESYDAKNAYHILLWLTYAYEPLHRKQIETILAINLDEEKVEEEGQMELKLELVIDSNLVTVDQSYTVLLAHASVKEFLLKSRNIPGLFDMNSKIAHEKLAQSCLIYLLQFVKHYQYFGRHGLHQRHKHDEHRWMSYLFGDYAVFHWAAHARIVELEEKENEESAVLRLTETFMESYLRHWETKYELFRSPAAEPLYWAATLGLVKSVDLFLRKGVDVNAQGGYYGSALRAAVITENKSIVQLLLSNGAEMNAQWEGFGNALQAAAKGGNQAIVKLLLETGADVNAPGPSNGTALQQAVTHNHEAIVRLLLEKGAEVNAQSGQYGNALQAAAILGSETIFNLLLKNGAEVNAQGGRHGSALQGAAVNGNKTIINILLEKGAEVNAQGGKYGNALNAAAYSGHADIVRLLFEKGAEMNLNAQSRSNRNPLHGAATRGDEAIGFFFGTALYEAASSGHGRGAAGSGHETVVRLLLEMGADVNAQGGTHGNALQAAAFNGNETIVSVLLEKGAEVNAQGGGHGNALQAAARRGHEAIVSLLLKKGAAVNAQGGTDGNALQAAASMGHQVIVNLLLEKGAKVNAQAVMYSHSGGRVPAHEYGNALQAATANGHETTVRLLLEKGAEINAQGGYHGNALRAAVHHGNKGIVNFLLQNGADVNAQGEKYGSALQGATQKGNEAIVSLLLDRGAELNAQGGEFGNALQAAVLGDQHCDSLMHQKLKDPPAEDELRSREAIINLLLEKGADVNAQGGKYGNALQAAAVNGNEPIVRLLLNRGAEVNTQGGEHGSALHAAANRGHEGIVHTLLERGAEVNAQGEKYGTALQAAAANGHDAIVSFLLENGADVNVQGGHYGNALQAAVWTIPSHKPTINLLLEKGAEVNAQEGLYGNALQVAACRGDLAIVKILLDKGAEVNAQGGHYGDALQAAASRGHEAIVNLLMEKGAAVNIQGGCHGSAIQAAEDNFHPTVVTLLLSMGAPVPVPCTNPPSWRMRP